MDSNDVIEYLKNMNDFEINMSINDLLTTHKNSEKIELINYILKIGKVIKDSEIYLWIKIELKKIVNCN